MLIVTIISYLALNEKPGLLISMISKIKELDFFVQAYIIKKTMAKEKSPIIESVKKVTPAVASIIVTKDLPKIKQYFLQPFGPWGWAIPEYRQEGTKRVKVGGGSGFVVSANGVILTNRHVVADPEAKYTVILGNGKKYPAHVWACDPINDIAIIQIKAKGLTAVKLGDSSQLELGQTVIAIGNALGEFQNTVSTGVVSGLSRFITAASASGQTEQLRGVIQTDAAINPGNSGGPLVDINGQVIGINAAVVWGAQNIGFTIPINKAKKDLEDLKRFGRIVQPSLGVRYIQLNKDLQEENKLPIDYGALIAPGEIPGGAGIVPGSAADRAGLCENDIILEFNGTKIDEKNSLASLIEECKVGKEVILKILRQGKKMKVRAILEERK